MRSSAALTALFLLACGGPAAPAPSSPQVAEPSSGGAVQTTAAHDAKKAEACEQRELILEAKVESLEGRLTEAENRLANNQRPSRPQIPRPDPATTYSVDVAGNAFRGAKDAKVTIVKGFEFACPFCQKSRATVDQLLKDYKGDIKVVYKSFVVHVAVAKPAALAACAASRQGKFERMSNALWTHGYDAYRSSRNKDKLGAKHIRKLARKYGKLKMRQYDKDLVDCEKQIAKDEADLKRVGMRGTPMFYINGRPLSGAQPVSKFRAIIDVELGLANKRIKKGTATVANYYQKFVFSAGKKSL